MAMLSGGKSMREWRFHIFAFSWIAHAELYLCRKNFNVVVPVLEHHSSMGKLSFANIISIYSLMYALGQHISRMLSDRNGPRVVVAIGMRLAATSNVAIAFYASPGASSSLSHYSWNILIHLLVMIALIGGVLQALLWRHVKPVSEPGKEAFA